MNRSGIVLLTLALCLLPAGGILTAQSGRAQAQNPDLARIQNEIARLRRDLTEVRRQTQTAERDLQAIDLELEIFTRELEMANQAERTLQEQDRRHREEISRLERRVTEQKELLAVRLAALYRLGNLSYVRLLLTMTSEENPLEAISMLSYLAGRDARTVEEFHSLRRQIALEIEQMEAKRTRISELRRLAVAKNEEIGRKRTEKAAVLAALKKRSLQSETRLAQLEEKAQRLQRLMVLLYDRKETRLDGRISEFKGALDWPLRGPVVEGFGRQRSSKFATYTVNNGIKIAAPAGSDVRAVFAGTVLYSQWFKGYGNLLLIDHGQRVFSLYGNTRGSGLMPGARVEAGQVIAKVAEGEDGSSGYLYFEVRENNEPADPRGWLR